MLATIVGSANGRSMTAFTSDLPRKSSRTSTHAISVPVTTLISATIAEIATVMISAARAAGAVSASTNWPTPPLNAFVRTAASGSRTMTLNHKDATPSPSGPPPPPVVVFTLRRGSARAAIGLARRLVVDLGHRARVRVEELVVDLAPAAEVVDRPQLLGRGEVAGELLRDRRVDRAEAGLGPRLLALRCVLEVDERLRLRLVLGGVDDRDRVLDLERRAGRVV